MHFKILAIVFLISAFSVTQNDAAPKWKGWEEIVSIFHLFNYISSHDLFYRKDLVNEFTKPR